MTALRGVDGKLVSGGKGKRKIPTGHCRRFGMPSENAKLDTHSGTKLNDRVNGENSAHKQSSGDEALERGVTADAIERCIANLQCQKAQGSRGRRDSERSQEALGERSGRHQGTAILPVRLGAEERARTGSLEGRCGC